MSASCVSRFSLFIGRRLLTGAPRRSYRAAVLAKEGAPLDVRTMDEALVAREPDECVVGVHAAGVNMADVRMIASQHHQRLQLPTVPGFEFAGEVLAVGKGVKRVKKGDRVLALKTNTLGAFAEQCVAREKELYAIPHSLSYEVASTIPVAYGTALLALKKFARVEEKESVLVLTTQGSLGLAAIDLALNVFKCKVIACGDSEEKLAIARSKGVQATVEYVSREKVEKTPKEGDTAAAAAAAKEPSPVNKDEKATSILRDAVALHTEKKGVDVVIDTVGGQWFKDSLKCLKPGGRICSLGFSSGQVPSVSLEDLQRYQAAVFGIWLGGFARDDSEHFHELIENIVSYIDEQYIDPFVGAHFKLDQVNEALRHVDDKASIGKVILDID